MIRLKLSIPLSLILMSIGVVRSPLSAQGEPPPRTKHVLHVYVDPIHGDDRAAYNMNPKAVVGAVNWAVEWGATLNPLLANNRSVRPLDTHPGTSTKPEIGGRIIHAPYPFKTINGPLTTTNATTFSGVLGYLANQILGTAPGARFPWLVPGTTQTVTHVIVHCLPGLYGPRGVSGQSDTDSDSGLVFNGERFPILMMENVSLQGSSALDTILDPRGTWNVGSTGYARHSTIGFVATLGLPKQYEETFVDSFTIRNNIGIDLQPDPIDGFRGDGTGAAIYIGGENEADPIISNNFIVRNLVGIAIESDTSVNPATSVHHPVIVNNTITVPNLGVLTYGIWSGDRTPLLASNNTRDNINYGRGAPMIFNNVISAPRATVLDVTMPPLAGAIALAGVHWDDMNVRRYFQTFLGVPSVVSVNNNYNAFQKPAGTLTGSVWNVVLTQALVTSQAYHVPATPFNGLWPLPAIQPTEAPPGGALQILNTAAAPGFFVAVRLGSVPGPTLRFVPRVDISPWTPLAGNGTLFIRDIFRNYIDAGAGQVRCDHDYRLAPTVRTATGVVSTNPLIGQGINLTWNGLPNSSGRTIDLFSFGLPLYTWGERDVMDPPGIPGNIDLQDVATFTPHCWDFDGADGWGNPRFDVNIAATPVRPEGDIDLGADEVGEIVISGYLNSTRIFSQPPALGGGNTPLTRACINPYYFWAPNGRIPVRPVFTYYYGFVEPWYQHVESFGMLATDKSWRHWSSATPPALELMPVARWTDTAGSRRGAVFGSPNPGVPRSMHCDFGTLLLPDPKAWGLHTSWPIGDNYGTLPWYNNIDGTVTEYRKWDNQHAYWYPSAVPGVVPGGPAASNKWKIEYSQPHAAMLASPGTRENNVAVTQDGLKVFLDAVAFPVPPVWPHTITGQVDINFDSWGVGDIGNTTVPQNVLNDVSYDPNWMWHGIRINCQADFIGGGMLGGRYSNLQTFLIVNGAPTANSSSGSNKSSGARPLPISSATPTKVNLKLSSASVQAAMKDPKTAAALKVHYDRIKALRLATEKLLKKLRAKK